MRFLTVCLAWAIAGLASASRAAEPVTPWAHLHGVETTPEGFRTTTTDARLFLGPMTPALSQEHAYLLLEISTPRETGMSVFWMKTAPGGLRASTIPVRVPSRGDFVTRVLDLAVAGPLDASDQISLAPGNGIGFTFNIRRVALVTREQVPAELLPELVDFRCITSKRHYEPGERIEYRGSWNGRNYPNRQSSKLLRVEVLDESGQQVASDVQQWGLLPLHQLKEVFGSIEAARPLEPGKYRLISTSVDQQDGLTLRAEHAFAVHGADDPPLCETPFKFLKDFSIIRGHDDRWHLFSITGDLHGGHDWYADGQERTFSHASSADLRQWTWHEPVISTTDARYPDGNGRFKDRNVWAPHVIRHGRTYYMFYTSVNGFGSQSVSLATSQDLFTWTDHPASPVLTLEGQKEFFWRRDAGTACRDPMVLVDGDRFYMYVTADAAEGEDRGAIAVVESDDLVHWRNPRIAARGPIASESPVVFKSGGKFYMFTSSHGAAVYESDHPVEGWKRSDIPRPAPQSVEKHLPVSAGYAEEIVALPDGGFLLASLTYQHWGNTIYFFNVRTDEHGRPMVYEPPFGSKD